MRKNYETYSVFTPSQPAELTFVDREQVNKQLVDSIRTPGRQLVIFGFSGSGKTTLINNKLNQLYSEVIESQCTKGTTIDQLKLEAFDALDKYYISEVSNTNGSEISASLKSVYAEIRAASKVQKGEKYTRVVPLQLTDKRLAEFIGESNACWKIEDFHKVGKEHKQRLAQIMKVFMDTSQVYKTTKIIAIGAVGTGKEIVEYDNEMSERISEIFVPLMSPKELENIITKGEKLLNVHFPKYLKNKIIAYSNGLGAICHQLCLSMCTNNNIYETAESRHKFLETDLDLSIEDYLNQKYATLKSAYEKATKTSKKSKYGTKEILKAIIRLNKSEVSSEEILDELRNDIHDYPSNTLTTYLNHLTSIDREEVLRVNADSKEYFFSNPFQKAYMELKFSKEKQTKAVGSVQISANELFSLIAARQQFENDFDDSDEIFQHNYDLSDL
ncbi:hypothetical protein [Prolixibacter denitrificans]|uniref:AAA ATPase-like protein n=1 Tax=Prolixibacter denitrificans TaxID=1541063 RepID=A0A2P8CF79_9BACT|nr:hypothetical protein [Prolixibacter denitrificans]PSK83635.1 hypothetical protein CLV93_10350 [Prolixibacter denitrificans]GET23184.1 hypothetical protein JCM18694_34300 [Prolixibacter denitrificans]